ncbi:hypothetical protein HG263_06920 [Pseudoalteromonas sp. JBTF-M23]|uniref:Uncharacterized protein n=1 Tax=Pseudoalteromonas caenipelagi TaxID=2726988 RepID=A0A849VCI7_9GAMM|nr:hypothetical protein [Pseudoalteromonas caenipelagi]NOU50273.1 hypothetical protein [Pseudoalteromonas caenipelagi]
MEAVKLSLIDKIANGRARYFVRLNLPDGDLLLHTGVGERRFLGGTWHGLGALGQVSEIPANDSNTVSSIRLTLTTPNSDILGEVAANDPIGSQVDIYLVSVDEHYRVDEYQLIESGFIATCDTERGALSKITLSVTGESQRWQQARLHQRWNDSTQKALYPGDEFFSEHASTVEHVLPDTQPGRRVGGNSEIRHR